MPESLAPGVYVEETSFRSRSIEGVSTNIAGLVGPARSGPILCPAGILTSLADFERIFGGSARLQFRGAVGTGTGESDNFLWHAARAFFAEGGRRLHVARVFRPLPNSQGGEPSYPPNFTDPGYSPFNLGSAEAPLWNDGHGRVQIGSLLTFRSRFPGQAGNRIIRLRVQAGNNVLRAAKDPARSTPSHPVYRPKLGALTHGDIVRIERSGSLSTVGYYRAEQDPVRKVWRFVDGSSATPVGRTIEELGLVASPRRGRGDAIRVITLTVQVLSEDRDQAPDTWANLPLDPTHQRNGSPDSVFARFHDGASGIGEARTLPLVVNPPPTGTTGLHVVEALQARWLADHPGATTDSWQEGLSRGQDLELRMQGGHDGQRPGAIEYEGRANDGAGITTGLRQLEDVEEISIVAAPGSTTPYVRGGDRQQADAIVGLLIRHAERVRYRIAVLDSPPAQSPAGIRDFRAKFDSKHAALYYPWITVLDPVSQRELNLPPSGFVAGIYARTDINRAVWKAPANEGVTLAIGFEQLLNKSQQEVLNPEGINCFRFFEGRGFRLWGARTISSDPEWKYVNLRRYFIYLERSIDRGTQWVVFEPNGETLWANVRRILEDFLLNEWQSGALLGDKPEKAFFVRCDRSTMTQNDLDHGRLICLIGVAPLRPAEFIVFRIGQWTADRRD
ncbi:MAG: phage tail sheath subtilisin-like domain-containing protein [Verrucomicrobiales bacterium]|nr:phage tail sheath subtilisin-like domain-containing protein [Verrucomicrobiales bacterium]